MRLWRRRRARRAGGTLHRYLSTDEQVLLATRQHPFALVREAFDTCLLLVPLLLAAWGIAGIEALRGAPATWLLRLLFAIMAFLVARLGWRVLQWEFERVVVTDQKVIHVSGVLDRRIASTPLAKVSEFTVRQPMMGRIFDYGSLVVDVPGGRDQALHGVSFLPDPAGIYRLVTDRARHGRMQEGGANVPGDAPVPRVVPSAESRSTSRPVVAPAPTQADLDRLAARRPDPWAPTLDGDVADHTIQIPRIPPT